MRSTLIAPFLAALSLLAACGDDGGAATSSTGSGSGGSNEGGSSGDGGSTSDGGSTPASTTSPSSNSVASTTIASTSIASTADGTGGTGPGTGGTGPGTGGAGPGTGGGGTGGAEPPTCPGEFECNDSECIPYAFFCDGESDCADAQDESPDACGGFIDGGGICDSEIGFTDNPGLNLCAGAACCAEFNACTGDAADVDSCIECFQAGGGALCDAALDCVAIECAGGGSAVCESTLTTGDLDRDACLGAECCEEHVACVGSGSEADVQACVDCFVEGSGPLCDAAIACGEMNCPFVEPAGICDSGLTSNDAQDDDCLSDACCGEFNVCTADDTDIDSCIACLEAGGGALCDAALDCAAAECP